MATWLPHVVGFSLIALTVGAMIALPRSWLSQHLSRTYGIRPSGPNNTYTRRDHFTGAALSGLLSVALLGCSAVAFVISERFPNLTFGNTVASTYFFLGFLLAAVAALAAAIMLWRGLFWRSSPDVADPTSGGERDA